MTNDINNIYHNTDIKEECALCKLPDLGVIRAQGEDAIDFLQGQLSNDLRDLDTGNAQFSSYNTHKGRMLALFLIIKQDQELLLILPKERLDTIIKRLRMFVLRSRVTLDDVSNDWRCMGLIGNCMATLLPDLPEPPLSVRQTDEWTAIRMPGHPHRALLLGQEPALEQFAKQLSSKGVRLTAPQSWRLANIQAGVPQIFEATAESFIPQMVNLDLLNGISFTKGCYTGQEVIARMKYLGELKRRMFHARFETDRPVTPGDPLYCEQVSSPQGAGKVVDAQQTAGNEWEALVVAVIDAARNHQLQLWDEQGPRLAISEPPYGLDESNS